MLLIHLPDRARGWFSLEMSLDTNELQSSKEKKKIKIIQFIPWEVALLMLALLPRDGFTPGAASHWSCPWWGGRGQRADQTLPDLPQQNFFQQKQWIPYGFVAFSRCPPGNTRQGVKARARLHPGAPVGEEPERGTRAKPPNKGRGRWKALSARSALITRQNSSRLGRKRSYVHKSTKD